MADGPKKNWFATLAMLEFLDTPETAAVLKWLTDESPKYVHSARNEEHLLKTLYLWQHDDVDDVGLALEAFNTWKVLLMQARVPLASYENSRFSGREPSADYEVHEYVWAEVRGWIPKEYLRPLEGRGTGPAQKDA
jgi:hypothetical protein